MAFTFTNAKARAEALISALPATPTPKELTIAFKAAQGLNCSNYATLETAIQTASNNQTGATPDADVMLINLLMGATQVRTNTYTSTEYAVTSNPSYPVPANATKCFVSCTARSSNGRGAAQVVDFEIGVSGGGTIPIVNGATQEIGNLVLYDNINQTGTQGKILLAGVEQPANGTTTFPRSAGAIDADFTDITLKFEITEVV